MESQDSFALWLFLVTVVAITLLPLVLCLAGLLWAPIGASIAALYARHRNISTGDAASTATLASVHMLVPWIHVMLQISNRRRRPVLETSFHIGALALWLLGPVLVLVGFGGFNTVLLILDRLNNPSSHPPENDLRFYLYLLQGVVTLVVGAVSALSWYRSLRQVGSEAQSARRWDLWLPMSVAHSLRMTMLWSAGGVVWVLAMVYASLVIWRDATVIW